MSNEKLQIMAVGRVEAIMQVVERLINSHEGWEATIALSEAEALAAFEQRRMSIVLVGAGFSAEDEESLRNKLQEIEPTVIVTRHYGGGSGLLENEILGILQMRK